MSIKKTILNVPFKDKDKAKQLGAKWDPQQKLWYIPPGLAQSAFAPWLSCPSTKQEIIINSIGLLRNIIPCWSCKGICTISGIYAKHIAISDDILTGFYILSEISDVSDSLAEFLILRCPNFKIGKANEIGQRYYRNHCDHCHIGFSDTKLHKKGKGLNPAKLADLKSMQCIELNFLDNQKVSADYIDYSSNELLTKNLESSDYLLDMI